MPNHEPQKSPHYVQSLFAYLDIIGFKAKIHKSLKFADEADAIYELLQSHSFTTRQINSGKGAPPIEMSGIKATLNSDSILLSLPGINDKAFRSFIHLVTYFQWETIDYYTFLRGAIVFGDVCHNKEVVFGPAYIQAYDIERKEAEWPRVVIDPQILDLLSEENRQFVFYYMLARDANGLPYIDFLRYMYLCKLGEEDRESNCFLTEEFVFRQHRHSIERALSEQRLSKHVLSIFHHASIYHNSSIDRICSEFQDGEYSPSMDEESSKRHISYLLDEKIDLAYAFRKYPKFFKTLKTLPP